MSRIRIQAERVGCTGTATRYRVERLTGDGLRGGGVRAIGTFIVEDAELGQVAAALTQLAADVAAPKRAAS